MVSVIMPVLNGEKTIKDSIVSIINQTYTEWELIIVDNGSTDKTEDICRVFVNDNPKISYLHCLEQGVVSARFKGVQSAKGEYIAFIDADDIMCNNMLQKMVETAKRENADIVSCGYVNVSNEKKENCSPKYAGVCDENKFFECLFQEGTLGFLWNKLYKKDVYLECVQPVNMEVCEDLYINCSLLLRPRKVVLLQDCLYEYYVNMNSVTRSIDKKIYDNGDWKYLCAYKEIEKLFVNDSEKLNRVKESEWWIIKLGLEELIGFDEYNITKKKLLNEMKQTLSSVFLSKSSFRFKIGYYKRYLLESLKVIGK